MKKLFVDDERDPPGNNWEVARNFSDAIEMLSTTEYVDLSLDHDIASFDENGREMTGYDIALFLAQLKMDYQYIPLNIICHSANPVGRARIEGVIARYLQPCPFDVQRYSTCTD